MTTTTEDLIRTVNANHLENMNHHRSVQASQSELKERLADLEQKAARRGGGVDAPAQSWGNQVTGAEAYTAFTTQMGMKGRVAIPVSAAITTGSAGPLIRPERQTEVVTLPRQGLTVRDLIAPGQTSSGMIEYTRQTGFTNNARVVTEGSLKPQSNLTYELIQTTSKTIAHWIPVSRQAMQDAAQLGSLIDSDLRYGLALAEEDQLLFGDGTGENLEGLTVAAQAYDPPFSVTGETNLDTLLLAIAQAQQAKFSATGIVVNDLDWAKMQALKDGEGRYLGAGPFGAQPKVAWTLPVVSTPSMPEGQFLVGAFRLAAQIFDHLEPTIFISDSHSDFFIRNQLAVLCEERVAMAVKRPEALVYGQFSAST